MTKIVAIIQARMGSSRLPGKILKNLSGKTVLHRIVDRLTAVSTIDHVVVATSDQKIDDEVERFCATNKIDYFRGSETDVLDRFYKAATVYNPTEVIRVTGDCPLIDPEIIRQLIEFYFEKKCDYTAVATGAGVAKDGFIGRFPDGMDAEIMKFSVLKAAHTEATKDLHREHVTPFIWGQPDRFSIFHMTSPVDYSAQRWVLDNAEDFEFISLVYAKLLAVKDKFSYRDVLEFLKNNPDIRGLNAHLIGQEGYEKFHE